MKKLALVLLIPIVIAANINVNIIASRKESDRHSHATGSDVSIINNIELETFQLYDGKLKDAIKAYFGDKPDDVYLKSRTPWGDLYTTYGWKQVERTLTPTKTEIYFLEYLPVEVSTQYINNTESEDTVKKITVRKEVENTVNSTWRTNGELARVTIHYDINIKSDFGETSINYDSNWGEQEFKSKSVLLGPEKDVEVTLKPGQTAKVLLMATKGEFKVRIDYEATLSGSVAANYNAPFKGHHFYSLDVAAVLNAGRLSSTESFTEDVTVKYYADYEVVVQDVDTKEILKHS